MAVVLVAGTNSWPSNTASDWYYPDHTFAGMLRANGIDVLSDSARPFIWSTDLDGVPGDGKHHTDWSAGGAALSYFQRMHKVPALDIIAHSHGLQVVLYAADFFDLRIDRLISVGSPVRTDMEEIAKKARPNIKHWLHVHSDASDRWQWFGELFDGHWGIVREHPLADMNDCVDKVGHSTLLREPKVYHYWQERGWIDFLKKE